MAKHDLRFDLNEYMTKGIMKNVIKAIDESYPEDTREKTMLLEKIKYLEKERSRNSAQIRELKPSGARAIYEHILEAQRRKGEDDEYGYSIKYQ